MPELRNKDLRHLWEHFVLNEIHAHIQSRKIFYWRDKRGHEIDFVSSHNKNPVVIECKWSASDFNPVNVIAFRRQYPEGENFVVANDVERSFTRSYYDIVIRYVNLKGMIDAITGLTPSDWT